MEKRKKQKNNYQQGLFSQLQNPSPRVFYYQLKYAEAIASTLMLPSIRKSQNKLEKSNSKL